MYEYEFYNKEINDNGLAYGYSEADARRRFPQFADTTKWEMVYFTYAD